MADIAGQQSHAPTLGTVRRRLSQGWFDRLLVGPAMVFIVAWPLVETFRLSFTDATLGGESYVGLENYEDLWDSRSFARTVGRTFFWMGLSVDLKLILGLIGATLLNAAIPGRGCRGPARPLLAHLPVLPEQGEPPLREQVT